MEKSSDAFRTISEVADDLDLPQHVLRFWETRFPQIRPLKRAGGRRFYRPADVSLLKAIRRLLYDEGYTIKGVQRLLKDQGTRGLRSGPEATSLNGHASAAELPADHADGTTIGLDIDDTPGVGDLGAEEHATDATGGDMATLREALAIIEDCERILKALTR